MSRDQQELVRQLFDEALGLNVPERERFVADRTPGDTAVRAEVLTLLRAHDTGFMADPLMAPPAPGAEPELGIQIGRYRLIREIGRGGMGVVFLARRNDDVFHKVVALKVIGADVVQGHEGVERFKKERQILAGLDHPNIARILDGGDTDDGRPFYVMEYISGAPIDDHCARVHADISQRVRMVAQICAAVDYLHDHAIIHRDLKPSNLLVTAAGQVKLLDFGIARVQTVDGLVGADAPPDQRTMLLTPGYASPEQVQGHEVTKRSDIYSLGAVLYELLTGRLPYADSEGRADLAAQLAGRDPVPPSRVIAERDAGPGRKKAATTVRRLTLDLDQVVLTALKRDSTRRHPTVQMLGEELTRVLDGRPLQFREDNWTYTLGHLLGRNRVAAVLAVLLIVALATAAVFAVQARIDRVRVESAQGEMERLVTLLNGRVEQWAVPGRVNSDEKVADVERAGQILASQALGDLAVNSGATDRTRGVVTGIRHFLDRADQLSSNETAVRKSIAVTYARFGDFQARKDRPRPAEGGKEAVASYQRAATIAASVEPMDRAWVEGQLAALEGRLTALGASLDVTLPAVAEAATPVTPAPVKTARSAVAASAPDGPAPMTPELERAVAHLEQVVRQVDNTRQTVEQLRTRLASQGQVLRPDINVSLAQVDGFVDQARRDVERGNASSAEENLSRVAYTLRRVVEVVGR